MTFFKSKGGVQHPLISIKGVMDCPPPLETTYALAQNRNSELN